MTGTSEIESTEWRLGRVLTASAIETWVADLPATAQTVVLRLGSWKRTGPFADARLQGALCLLHRRGIKAVAAVPPITLVGSRATAAFSEPDPKRPQGPSTPTELNLASTIAGLLIGQLCSFDDDHTHIPDLQRQALQERGYLFGWGPEKALAVPSSAESTGFPRRPAVEREATFHYRLRKILGPLGGPEVRHTPSVSRWFNALKTFAFEASENTWDHGRLSFDGRPVPSIRFVRLRRIDVGKTGFDIADVAPGFQESFESYLDRLRAARDLPATTWDERGGRLVEVTIADGGVGIAARMAGGFEVFDGPLDMEARHVVEALLPGGTTKSLSEVGRGQGFRKMLRACHRLSGLTIVRTGRLRISKTYRRTDGSNEDASLGDSDSEAYLPEINRVALPLLAGTSVSLIFPVDSPGASTTSAPRR